MTVASNTSFDFLISTLIYFLIAGH